MTDSRMRERERLAFQGDADAQVQVLVERIRKGQLDVANVELAAKLGHEVARKVLPEVSEVKDPITHMCQHGNSVMLTAVLAYILRRVCSEWGARAEFDDFDDVDIGAPHEPGLYIGDLSIEEDLCEMRRLAESPTVALAGAFQARLPSIQDAIEVGEIPVSNAEKKLLLTGMDTVQRCCEIVINGSNDPAAFKELHRSFARFLSATGAGRKAKSLAKQSMLKAAADTLLI